MLEPYLRPRAVGSSFIWRSDAVPKVHPHCPRTLVRFDRLRHERCYSIVMMSHCWSLALRPRLVPVLLHSRTLHSTRSIRLQLQPQHAAASAHRYCNGAAPSPIPAAARPPRQGDGSSAPRRSCAVGRGLDGRTRNASAHDCGALSTAASASAQDAAGRERAAANVAGALEVWRAGAASTCYAGWAHG